MAPYHTDNIYGPSPVATSPLGPVFVDKLISHQIPCKLQHIGGVATSYSGAPLAGIEVNLLSHCDTVT